MELVALAVELMLSEDSYLFFAADRADVERAGGAVAAFVQPRCCQTMTLLSSVIDLQSPSRNLSGGGRDG